MLHENRRQTLSIVEELNECIKLVSNIYFIQNEKTFNMIPLVSCPYILLQKDNEKVILTAIDKCDFALISSIPKIRTKEVNQEQTILIKNERSLDLLRKLIDQTTIHPKQTKLTQHKFQLMKSNKKSLNMKDLSKIDQRRMTEVESQVKSIHFEDDEFPHVEVKIRQISSRSQQRIQTPSTLNSSVQWNQGRVQEGQKKKVTSTHSQKYKYISSHYSVDRLHQYLNKDFKERDDNKSWLQPKQIKQRNDTSADKRFTWPKKKTIS